MNETRKLAAILAADVVGYSRLASSDEDRTLARLRALRSDLIDPTIAVHHGRVVKRTGDGALVEFRSVVDAVRCAIEVQNEMVERNAGVAPERRIEFRIGIHLGDVVEESDGDLMGDGVNIAARLEGIAQPNGICLSGAAYEQVRDKLNEEFEDLGDKELKNIARPVRAYRLKLIQNVAKLEPVASAVSGGKLALPDKPSIAVLPFENLSGDPEQEYFADGMVEEIITALSRMRWLFVIARNSSFVYKNRTFDIKQVGRELGVRYALEGSVRRAGDKVRIAGQLIDTATGHHIWADRYDGRLSDVFNLQDRIAESVVGAIQPSILTAEMERSARKRPDSLVAYDYVLRALPLVWSLSKSESEKAQTLLERALAIEPAYPLALSLAAWCHGQRVVYNWTEALEEERKTALHLAQQAATISRNDPMVLAILGAAHTIVRDFGVAAEHLERALSLDPNSAWAWNRSGWLNVHRGRPTVAIQQFERAIRLSPFDPSGFVCFFGIADAYFLEARYEEVIKWSEKGLSQQPNAFWQLRVLVPALVKAGRAEDARRMFVKLIEHFPTLTIENVRKALPFNADMMDRIVEGLRQAGLPE